MNYVIARGSSNFRQNSSHGQITSEQEFFETWIVNSRSQVAFQSADWDLIQR